MPPSAPVPASASVFEHGPARGGAPSSSSSSSPSYAAYGGYHAPAPAPMSMAMPPAASHLSVTAPPPLKAPLPTDAVPPPPITPSTAAEVHAARWGPVHEMHAI
jgi:hypothetical protein